MMVQKIILKIISDYKNNSKVMAVYQKNKGLNKSNNLAIKLERKILNKTGRR